mgnify:CR=1 FL=1
MVNWTGTQKDTKDILLALGIPHFIGLDAPEQNAGVVRNSGVEAMVGFRKTFGEFTFNTSFNLDREGIRRPLTTPRFLLTIQSQMKWKKNS